MMFLLTFPAFVVVDDDVVVAAAAGDYELMMTYWGRNKMDAIFQPIYSNGLSWMKMYDFRRQQTF